MVSVLQAPPLLLLSTGSVICSLHSVVLQWITTVCTHSLEQQFPLLHEERESLYFPSSPARFIRYEELTHNPFMQTQMEPECV